MTRAGQRAIIPFLRRALSGPDNALSIEAARLIARFAPKRKPLPPRKIEKRAKRAVHAQSTRRIREACLERADGQCENPDCKLNFSGIVGAPEMDHWLSGNGRRRQKQSVETCWMLCHADYRDRTEHVPSVAHWNALFLRHCLKYGYHFTQHIEHARLP